MRLLKLRVARYLPTIVIVCAIVLTVVVPATWAPCGGDRCFE